MPDIKPFLPARPSGIVFIALNTLRVLSIISLLLVFSANIVTISHDVKAIKDWENFKAQSQSSNSTLSDEEWDCEYVEYSTVPDQAGGPFWSILNRIFILFECLLLTMSEVGIPKRLFEEYLPILGPAHGLGCLGVFQALIGAQVLSHYCELFPQVTAWLLFIIGCFNIVAGILFRSKCKTKRLIFSWENVSQLTPQTRMAATAWNMVSEKRNPSRGGSDYSHSHSHSHSDESLSRSSTQANHKPETKFKSGDRDRERGRGRNEDLLVPEHTKPGAKFGGFGFGRQGEKVAEERGYKISRPMESLPRYAT